MIRTCFFGREHKENLPCVSSGIQPHDVVGATRWPKFRAGARKGADAETVTGGLNEVGIWTGYEKRAYPSGP